MGHPFPVLVNGAFGYLHKQNCHWWGWQGGGGVTATIASAILVPGSNPQNMNTISLANLANFHVAAILAISTFIIT